MQSCLPSAAAAIRHEESSESGTPAGTVVVRAAGLRVHGGTVTAEGQVPSAGELALFCRPVVPAVMMAPFLRSWSPMRQPTAGMAGTPRCCG